MIRHTGFLAGMEGQSRREVSYWCVNGHYTPCRPPGHPATRARGRPAPVGVQTLRPPCRPGPADPPSRQPCRSSRPRLAICWNAGQRPSARRCWPRRCSACALTVTAARVALDRVDPGHEGRRRIPASRPL